MKTSKSDDARTGKDEKRIKNKIERKQKVFFITEPP
jgi:hypothetical protein